MKKITIASFLKLLNDIIISVSTRNQCQGLCIMSVVLSKLTDENSEEGTPNVEIIWLPGKREETETIKNCFSLFLL